MKLSVCNQFIIFFLSGILSFPVFVHGRDLLPSGEGNYSGSRVRRVSGGRELEIVFSMSPTVLKSQEFLSVYPRYVSADGKNGLELTPLYFSGRRRYKVIRRRRVLHREEKFYPPVENVRSSRDLEREVVLTARFPFEAWMADGHLEVVEKRAGCAECGSGGFAGRVLEATLPFFRPEDYRYSFVKPKQVPLKMIFDCNVLFPWDRDELMDDFEANGRELSVLQDFIDESLKIRGVTVQEMLVQGYASPEGEAGYNKALAERRARALLGYVTERNPVLKGVAARSEGVGEDWGGLLAAVAASSLPGKARVEDVIGRYSGDREREAAIRELDNGQTYRLLLKDFYPPLRRTSVTLFLAYRTLSIPELEVLFAVESESLSHYELYMLAEHYAGNGKNPLPLYRAALEQFPGDAEAVLNYANALLKYGHDAAGALQLLEQLREDDRVLYPMAVAYSMQGVWKKAEELLEEAAHKGDTRGKIPGLERE